MSEIQVQPHLVDSSRLTAIFLGLEGESGSSPHEGDKANGVTIARAEWAGVEAEVHPRLGGPSLRVDGAIRLSGDRLLDASFRVRSAPSNPRPRGDELVDAQFSPDPRDVDAALPVLITRVQGEAVIEGALVRDERILVIRCLCR